MALRRDFSSTKAGFTVVIWEHTFLNIHSRNLGAHVPEHLTVPSEETVRFILSETRDNLDSPEVRCELQEHAIVRAIVGLLAEFLQAIEGLLTSVRCYPSKSEPSGDDVIVRLQTFQRHDFRTAILEFRDEPEVAVPVAIDVLLDEVNLVLAEVQWGERVLTLTVEGFENFLVGGLHVLEHLKNFTLVRTLATRNHSVNNLREVLARSHLVEIDNCHDNLLRLLGHLPEYVQNFLKPHTTSTVLG